MLKFFAGALLAFLPLLSVHAQEPAPEISLLTFGPGSLYWERFGHNAILVREGAQALAYNYGIFDFQQKNFFLNFARGYMTYRIAADPLDYDLRLYAYEHRWVVEQKLALAPAQAVKLRDFLVWNARPEHAEYRYDYFLANCSTRVRDALDMATGGALAGALRGRPAGTTYRNEAVRLISPDLPFALAMDAALGPSADRPIDLWQQSFVPMALMQALRSVRVQGEAGAEVPLVAGERRILGGSIEEPPAQAPDWRLPMLLAGLGIAALLVATMLLRRRLAARLLFASAATFTAFIAGLGGVILLLLWGFTQHWAGWRNANLLLFDPLDWLLIPALLSGLGTDARVSGFARSVAVIAAVAALASVPLCFVAHYQRDTAWIALWLPAQLALVVCLVSRARPRQPQA